MGKKKSTDDAAAFAASAARSASVSSEAAASDAMREGMDLFLDKARQWKNLGLGQRKGHLFECIEAAKFNAAAAREGSGARAHVTASEAGRAHDPVDIEIRGGRGKVFERHQLKVSNNPRDTARSLSDPKYAEIRRHAPVDQVDVVRDVTRDGEVTGELKHRGVSSGGTDLHELRSAAKNPKGYVLRQELRQVGREGLVAGGNAAATGAIIGGAISALKNIRACSGGEIDGRRAARNIASDAAGAGGRSGGAGVLGALLRHGAIKAKVPALARSNAATAMAAGLIEAADTICDYAKGKVSIEVAAERLGRTGWCSVSGLHAGAAAGAVFGPAGVAVGSIAGYVLAATVYQSCIAAVREARLAEEEADRVVALCEHAVHVMGRRREQVELELAARMDARRAAVARCFEAIDQALVANQPNEAGRALGDLAAMCGKELRVGEFEDFDRFMTGSDAPLVL